MTPIGQLRVVLASTSRYRAQLLSRVVTRFEQAPPGVDETARPDESPMAMAARLAGEKAAAVAARHAGAVVIGSDQVAVLNGTLLGKPGGEAAAREQLQRCSGRAVEFHTAICVVDDRTAPARTFADADLTRVRFRQLGDDEIRRYVGREQPLDCAGSFKAEGLGVGLFESIESHDPTALIGLPLIVLCRLFREAGIDVI